MNKKGQALVEFVLIIPVLIMVLFLIIDFGRIYYTKITLTGELNDVNNLYKDGNSTEEIEKKVSNNIKNVKLYISNDESYVVYKLEKKIDIITPGLNKIIGSPYVVTESRTVYYE